MGEKVGSYARAVAAAKVKGKGKGKGKANGAVTAEVQEDDPNAVVFEVYKVGLKV